MKRVKLDKQEFIDMFNSYTPTLRVCLDEIGIHPADTNEERLLKLNLAFNPPMPQTIILHTEDGAVEYYWRE